jgi:hypothetical protein
VDTSIRDYRRSMSVVVSRWIGRERLYNCGILCDTPSTTKIALIHDVLYISLTDFVLVRTFPAGRFGQRFRFPGNGLRLYRNVPQDPFLENLPRSHSSPTTTVVPLTHVARKTVVSDELAKPSSTTSSRKFHLSTRTSIHRQAGRWQD